MCLLERTFSSLHYELRFCNFYLGAQINTVKYLLFCDNMPAFRDDAWPSKQLTNSSSVQSACMHGTCIRPQRSDTASKHKATQGNQPMLFQCWPASPSLAQHWNSIGWMSRVCCGDCIIFLQICRNTMQSSHLPRKHKIVHHHVSVSRDLYLCRYSHVIMTL